jgi:hypothetical protein
VVRWIVWTAIVDELEHVVHRPKLATLRPTFIQTVNFYCISSGKIVEERGQPDLLALLQQIGAVPV